MKELDRFLLYIYTYIHIWYPCKDKIKRSKQIKNIKNIYVYINI